MTVTAASLPDRISENGNILTFIVPAPNGCDLDCPYCFIDPCREPSSVISPIAATIPDATNAESWLALLDHLPETVTFKGEFSVDVSTITVVLLIGLLAA